nr:unnamed protein product [Callosobruchus analis]
MVRRNRKRLPKSVVNTKLKKGEIVANQNKNNVVFIKWHDKRDVLLLSTKHTDEMKEVYHREGPRQKPSVVVDYHNAKAFVDLSHQKAASANSLRRSVKWYRKLAIELITGTSLVNPLHLYNKINDKKVSVTTFKENLTMEIFRSINPPDSATRTHGLQIQKPRVR